MRTLFHFNASTLRAALLCCVMGGIVVPAQTAQAGFWSWLWGGRQEGAPVPPPATPAPPRDLPKERYAAGLAWLDGLDAMPGLERVKMRLVDLYEELAWQRDAASAGHGTAGARRAIHLAFVGPAGSGKTTVAQRFAQAVNLLHGRRAEAFRVGERSDFIASFMGHTAMQTRLFVQTGRGGPILIDNAPAIFRQGNAGDPQGEEAIDALIASMKGSEPETLFVFIGDSSGMESLLESKPRLRSLLSDTVIFPELQADQLERVLVTLAEQQHFVLDPAVLPHLRPHLARLARHPEGGSAGRVNEWLRVAEGRWMVRMIRQHTLPEGAAAVRTLLPVDFDLGDSAALQYSALQRVERAEAELKKINAMPGLEAVAAHLGEIFYGLAYDVLSHGDGPLSGHRPLHLAFTGPPGTGKTTVAHIFARCLRELGILAADNVVVTSRQDFVAEYMGQTSSKSRRTLERARGGVLFIDEAYGLISHRGDDAYGHEALVEIIRFMEEEREDSVVILAGYEAEMQQLFAANVGLARRVTDHVHFPVLQTPGLLAILTSMAQHQGFTVSDAALAGLRHHVERARRERHFGNAGAMRNLVDRAITAWKARYVRAKMAAEADFVEPARRLDVEDFGLPQASGASADLTGR